MGMGKIIFEGNLEEYALSKHSQLSDVTLLMRELRRRGVDISENIFDVETAFEEIMNIKKVSIEHE
jgi:predicted HTH domain antitoxin